MRATAVLAGILALLLLAGCAGFGAAAVTPGAAGQAQPAGAGDVGEAAATVNGQAIPVALYRAQLEVAVTGFAQPGLSPQSPDVLAALREQVLQMLIDQVLVDQAAARMGIAVDDAEVDAEVQRVRGEAGGDFAGWLQANGYSEETFRAQVRSDLLGAAVRERVTAGVAATAEQVRLRQVLVEREDEARALADQIRQGQATLEELARARSLDQASRESGGDLGYLPRGILPPAVEQMAFALAPGETSDPVQSPLGWHILQLEARDVAREIPPDMLNTLRQQAFMRWLEGERAQATIERFVE